jgi:hypothetical protein
MADLEGGNVQPVDLFVVCETEDEFVDYAINANSSADEFKLSILRVVEYEVVTVEGRKCGSSNTAGHLYRNK